MKGHGLKLSRILPILTISIAASVALSGCVPFPTLKADSTSAPVETQAAPEETTAPVEPETTTPPAETAAPEETTAPAPVDGEVAAAGTKAAIGAPLTYEFTNTDDGVALISAKLIDVTPATAEELAVINDAFDADELKGYDVWLIHFEETKVSGAVVEFNSDYSYFSPADASGNKVASPTLIGWDGCASESFTEEFDNGEPLEQCMLAAAPSGGNLPVGMMYTGGYQDDNPYDYYDGTPLYFGVE